MNKTDIHDELKKDWCKCHCANKRDISFHQHLESCEHCTQQKDAGWEDELQKIEIIRIDFDKDWHLKDVKPSPDLIAFISEKITQARQQGEAYKGKQNRESYMKGYQEGRQQALQEVLEDVGDDEENIVIQQNPDGSTIVQVNPVNKRLAEIRANIEKRRKE